MAKVPRRCLIGAGLPYAIFGWLCQFICDCCELSSFLMLLYFELLVDHLSRLFKKKKKLFRVDFLIVDWELSSVVLILS